MKVENKISKKNKKSVFASFKFKNKNKNVDASASIAQHLKKSGKFDNTKNLEKLEKSNDKEKENLTKNLDDSQVKNKSIFSRISSFFNYDKLSLVKNKIENEQRAEDRKKKHEEILKKKLEKKKDKKLRQDIKKNIKNKKSKAQINRFFEDHIEKAGLDIKLKELQKKIMFNAFMIVIFETIVFVIHNALIGTNVLKIILDSILLLTLGTILHYNIIFFIFFIFIDMRIYNRKKAVEEVLPEYLQLVGANISAGMPIDQSLWLAVRPQFGVLSKEMEIVAKKSLTGTNLNSALFEFSEKYDSVLLKRTIHLMIEGIEAGGPLANLLDRITTDIIETKIMKKEMAANVMTYVIFITFASIVAAPFMFGLANQLVVIITGIMGSIDVSNMQGSMFNISGEAVSIVDFQIFSIMLLVVSAIFSGMIISVIKNGNIRDGLKNIPGLIIVSLIIYFLSVKGMGMMFSGMF